MKWLKFWGILLGLGMVGCAAAPEEVRQAAVARPVALPDSFYMQLRGTAGDGDMPVTFDVFREDSTLKGEYFLESNGRRMEVWGEIWPNGHIYLEDKSKADRETMNFVGQFVDSETVKGVVFDLNRLRMDDFQLKRSTRGVLDIQTEYFQERACERVPLKAGEYSEYALPGDSVDWCSGVYIDKFRVSTGNPKVDKEINFALAKAIFSQYSHSKSISEYLETIPARLARHHRQTLGMNSHGIFSIIDWHSEENITLDNYHKMSDRCYFNFDIQTGRPIMLNEILLPEARHELGLMLLPMLKEEQRYLEFGLEDLPGNHFLVSTEGLWFNHFLYRSDSGVDSLDHEILLPYPRILHLLRGSWVDARWRESGH